MACEGEMLSVELSLTRNSLALKHVISFMRKRKALLMGDGRYNSRAAAEAAAAIVKKD